MTPEERAADIMDRCWAEDRRKTEFRGLPFEITAAIRAAVAEEREAIKKLVATHLNDGAQTDDGISADRTAASILYEIEQRSVPTYDPVEMPK